MRISLTFIVLMVLISCSSHHPTIENLIVKSKSKEKLCDDELYRLMAYYSSRNEQQDSLFKELLTLATFNKDDQYVNEIYESYYSNKKKLGPEDDEPIRQWIKMTKLGDNPQYSFNSNYAYYNYLKTVNVDSACLLVQDLAFTAASTGSPKNLIRAQLAEGECLQEHRQITKAYKIFLNALTLAKKSNLDVETEMVLNDIYALCTSIKRFEKAEIYIIDLINLSIAHQPVDSVKYFDYVSKLSDTYFDMNSYQQAKEYSDKVLEYATRTHNEDLIQEQLTVIRSYYIENNKLAELHDLYKKDYPELLEDLKKNDYARYLRVQCLLFGYEEKYDSVNYYINLTFIPENFNKMNSYEKATFYNRLGRYFLQLEKVKEAIGCYDSSYTEASRVNYTGMMLMDAQKLDSLYAQVGDIQQAFKYRGYVLTHKDEIQKTAQNEDFWMLEMNNTEKERERLKKQEEVALDKRNNLQYMAIGIMIPFFFILFLFIGSAKVPKYVIRFLGYLNVIFLFEFIILLADHKIHHITHGAPLPILGFKIVLIGILLPIHHWVEHRIVHYVLHNRVIDTLTFKQQWTNLMNRIKLTWNSIRED